MDKSRLPGKFKALIYQHGIRPRLLWPLLVYDIPLTTVEGFERKISHFLRRWLCLPHIITSIVLYAWKNNLQLPFSGLIMVFQAREVLLYRESNDTKVSLAGIEVRMGSKWRAQEAVNQAEAQLRHSVLVGTVESGRAGLGCYQKPRYDKARGKDRCKLFLK